MAAVSTYEVRIADYFQQAWALFKERPVEYLVLGFLITASEWFYVGVLTSLVPLIFLPPLTGGLIYFTLKEIRGVEADFSDMFRGFDSFLRLFIAGLLIAIFEFLGILFCCIPYFLVITIYLFVYQIIVDEGLDFWEAMEASRQRVMDNFFSMLGLAIVLTLLNLAGMCFCGVGSIATYPFTIIVGVAAYRDIFRRP